MRRTVALCFVALACLALATWGSAPRIAASQILLNPVDSTLTSIGPINLSDGKPFRISFVLPAGGNRLATPFVMQFRNSAGRVVFTEVFSPAPVLDASVTAAKVFSGAYYAPTASSPGRIDLFAFPGGPVVGSWVSDDGVMAGTLIPATQALAGDVDQPVFPFAASLSE